MVTTIPSRVLISGILEEYSRDDISKHFHIGAETDISSRLNDFNKNELLEFLLSTESGKTRFAEIQRIYPFSKSPTLYLIYVSRRPNFSRIIGITSNSSTLGREEGLILGEGKSVRIVFIDQPGNYLQFRNNAIEIPINYERRFEYNIGDPNSEKYGEHVIEYSLEQAYIWLIDNYSHGILCCNDFVAISPIIKFVSKLDIECSLPNLTEYMLNRLAAEAPPRSATFSSQEIEERSNFDIKTVVVSDPLLQSRQTYINIRNDTNRSQTSGFYSNHPDLPFGGLGISRRYGRMWTPVHLSRNNLVALSEGLINHTEQELSREYERSSSGFVSYFRNIPFIIGNYTVKGKERDVFDSLLTNIIEANKGNNEAELSSDILHNLIKYQNHLALLPMSSFDCPNCGEGILGKCNQCGEPFIPIIEENQLIFKCPECKTTISTEEYFLCECGEDIQILATENHIRIFPEESLLSSIHNFLSNINDVMWNGTFVIDGHILKLFNLPERPIRGTYHLDDLRNWRINARYHLRDIPDTPRTNRLIKILNKSREKCDINNYHPKSKDCERCIEERVISVHDVENGSICLPRIMGIAISKKFDGLHHRYEITDVKYTDILEQSKTSVNVGIHLKSRERRVKRVGRGNKKIKGLYTQTLFSAYQILKGEINLDIIGISIPNVYIEDVIESMQEILNLLGIPILIINLDDWLKILDTTLEQLEFQESTNINQGHLVSNQ